MGILGVIDGIASDGTSIYKSAGEQEFLDRPEVRRKESSAYNHHSIQLAKGAANPSYATVTSRRSSHAIRPGLTMVNTSKDKTEEAKSALT